MPPRGSLSNAFQMARLNAVASANTSLPNAGGGPGLRPASNRCTCATAWRKTGPAPRGIRTRDMQKPTVWVEICGNRQATTPRLSASIEISPHVVSSTAV